MFLKILLNRISFRRLFIFRSFFLSTHLVSLTSFRDHERKLNLFAYQIRVNQVYRFNESIPKKSPSSQPLFYSARYCLAIVFHSNICDDFGADEGLVERCVVCVYVRQSGACCLAFIITRHEQWERGNYVEIAKLLYFYYTRIETIHAVRDLRRYGKHSGALSYAYLWNDRNFSYAWVLTNSSSKLSVLAGACGEKENKHSFEVERCVASK